jgi:uncharacterized protein DUF4136
MFALIGMTFLFGGMSSAQRVKTDYDRSANFTQYKTYSWEHVRTKDALDIDRIKNAVNVTLAGKGLTQVNSGGDVSILTIEITRTEQMHVSYDGITGGSGWTPGLGGVGDTETYKVGTLLVESSTRRRRSSCGGEARVARE